MCYNIGNLDILGPSIKEIKWTTVLCNFKCLAEAFCQPFIKWVKCVKIYLCGCVYEFRVSTQSNKAIIFNKTKYMYL